MPVLGQRRLSATALFFSLYAWQDSIQSASRPCFGPILTGSQIHRRRHYFQFCARSNSPGLDAIAPFY